MLREGCNTRANGEKKSSVGSGVGVRSKISSSMLTKKTPLPLPPYHILVGHCHDAAVDYSCYQCCCSCYSRLLFPLLPTMLALVVVVDL